MQEIKVTIKDDGQVEIDCNGFQGEACDITKVAEEALGLVTRDDKDLKVCCVEGCSRQMLAKGFCSKHYQRFKKNGDPKRIKAVRYHGQKCGAKGCDNAARIRGYCRLHYSRWRKNGHTNAPDMALNSGYKCSVQGCENGAYCRGWCQKHYARWRKYTNPLALKRPMMNKSTSLKICNERGVKTLAELPEYRAWVSMWDRLVRKYYCRGIGVNLGWSNFEYFYRDMGAMPGAGYVLHRSNNDLDYTKENCAWMEKYKHIRTHFSKLNDEQVRSIRREWMTGSAKYKELAQEYGISADTIRQVIRRDTWKGIEPDD